MLYLRALLGYLPKELEVDFSLAKEGLEAYAKLLEKLASG